MSAARITGRARAGRPLAALGGTPPWLLAALLAAVYVILAPQSPDLAAASYRSHLFSAEGLSLWDNSWYGGHHLLAYSLLAPALGALIGPALLAALSMVLATGLFSTVLAGPGARVSPPARQAAALWFALGASVALLSSRVPFDLGLAVGLGALAAAQRRHARLAAGLALLTSLASPVAGAFLAMAMLAWAFARPGRGRAAPLLLCLVALAPIALLSVAFPEGGSQPFVGSAFWPALAAVIVVGLAIPPNRRELRIGALLYAAVLIGSFLLPSAVGGNADRLGALAAGPVAACALLGAMTRWRRLLLLALVAPLTYWQANAPVADYVSTVGNAATRASYYRPLLDELTRLGIGYGRRPARIEVVATVDHWEARYVAPATMIARGWERQLDRYRNGLFYGARAPTAAAYRVWLEREAVSYVALPDASLDYSAKGEARLLRSPEVSGPRGYLREVWSGAHWRLYAVRSPVALTPYPAVLTAVGRQSFTLSVPAPGSYRVLIHFTPYWRLASGHGCVERSGADWTQVRAQRAGAQRVAIGFSLARVLDRGRRCN
ncbi:MAG: hypothetical protein ACYDC2_01140 [Solirubrobacteraceae bacterium]